MIWVYVLSSYVAIGLALTLIFAIVIVIQEALVLNVIKMAFGFPYWLLYLFLKVLAYLKSIYQLGHRIAYQADLYRYGFASWSELATVKGYLKVLTKRKRDILSIEDARKHLNENEEGLYE